MGPSPEDTAAWQKPLSLKEEIAKAGHFEDLPEDDQLYCDETLAKGEGPFDEAPPWRRRRAVLRV